MCYDATARPPIPPIKGGAVPLGEEHVLIAEDGTRLAAYSSHPEQQGGPGVVILPDVRGLHPFYQELARRFAQAGIHATAIDYFGRTAGVGQGPEERGEDFDYMPLVRQTTPDTIAMDVRAAVTHLRSSADRIYTVGFCFGGRNSFNQAARKHGLTGVIGFYGRVAPTDESDKNAPTLLASGYEYPVLGLFGGADQGITKEHVAAFGKALDEASVANELVTYGGAPHSFFDRTYEQYAEASANAWGRVLVFVGA
jgi:carboxymethylenebutenolidase